MGSYPNQYLPPGPQGHYGPPPAAPILQSQLPLSNLLPQRQPFVPPTQSISQPIPSGTRILHFQSSGIPEPQVLISDTLSSTPLYSIISPKRSLFTSSPHLIIKSCSTSAPIATIRFHTMTDDIDLVIHGEMITFKSSIWSSSHEVTSRVPGVGQLKWKDYNVLKGGDVKCTDGAGNVVARIEARTWGEAQKEGRFELGPSVIAGGVLLDEIVTSAIAMVEFKRKKSGQNEVAVAMLEVIGAGGGVGVGAAT